METKPAPGLIWRVIVVFVGMVALLLAYYWVHKPIDAGLALVLGGSLLDLLTVGALFAIAGGIGRRALLRLDLAVTRPERLALEAVLGLGLVSLAALILGLAGLFRAVVMWPALLLTAVLLRHAVLGWLTDWRSMLDAIQLQGGWLRFLAFV